MENLKISTNSLLSVEEREPVKLSEGEMAGRKPCAEEMTFLAVF